VTLPALIDCETEPRLTYREWWEKMRSPTKDHSYLLTRLGPSVESHLAWLKLGQKAERTRDSVERTLARLAIMLPDLDVADVTTEDCMLFLQLYNPPSWRKIGSHLRVYFKWACAFGYRPDNPMDRMPTMRAEPARVYDIFTAAEQAAIVNGARQTKIPAADVARVHLRLSAGTRKSEELGIRVRDINMAERFVVVTGKGNKERLIPLRGPVIHALDEFLLTEIPIAAKYGGPRLPLPDDFLWFPLRVVRCGLTETVTCYPWKPMSSTAYQGWWKLVTGLGKVKYRKGHMARHTYATEALDATEGDHVAVMELLGHSSPKVTMVYIHSQRRRLEGAAEKLAQMRKAGGE
jgi:site-specific recombinase XerD